MRKLIAVCVALLGLGLSGCTGPDMKKGVADGCGFYAKQQDLIKLATKLGGAIIPGSVFAFDTAETVVTSVCEAYNKQKAVRRESSIHGVVVNGVFIRRS